MLRMLLIEDQEGKSMIDFVKSISIKDVVYMSAAAWDDIPVLTLAKSWQKLLGGAGQVHDTDEMTSSSEDQSDELTCEELIHRVDCSLSDDNIEKWISGDANNPGYQLLTEEEIVQQARNGPASAEDDESDEDPDEPNIVSNGEAAEMLDKCMRWFEQQQESTPSSLLLLKRIRDLATSKRYSHLKQLKLTSFFAQS